MSQIQHKDHFHGSDLEKIEEIYGIRKEEILSFSANVNPLGISPKLRLGLTEQIDAISSYPDRRYTALRRCIGQYLACDMDQIIVGNGSTELISLFIDFIHPRKALILGPTYSEYERSVALSGGRSHYYPLRAEEDFFLHTKDFCSRLAEGYQLLILCNPNNPTSSLIPRDQMRQILDTCKMLGIYVIVDETYIEFVSDIEASTSVPLTRDYNNVIVLRGTSKFFAAPGLRLGYAVLGNADMIAAVQRVKNPWMINSLADVAGQLMFTDEDYKRKTRDLILSERKRLYPLFRASDRFYPFLPNANFILLRIEDPSLKAGDLFDRCIRQKMMIRDCSSFPFLSDRYIRFCFMREEDNQRLADLLLS